MPAWCSSRTCSWAPRSAATRARSARSAACAPAASTTTSTRSATPRATTPSSRCWATSASATTSSATPSCYAWELLTGVWGLPKDRLLVTVYHTDDEAFDLWHKEVGLPVERIIRIGDNKGAPYASDNFWQMADTGPCGPCTEIFYDHGDAHRRRPARVARTRTATASSKSGTTSSCSSTASPTARWCRCRRPAWTPAWAWSAWPPCCSTCTATTKSTCSST